MLNEEVEVRIPPNLVAWRTESNFLALASCFCTVFLLDTSDLILFNFERRMLNEEVEVRIPPNLVAWRTESNFLALASCFCTVFLLDT